MAGLSSKLNLGFLSSIGQKDGYVAFDIGSSSVKMVEAAVDKSGCRLLNVGVLPLPPGAVQNNMVMEGRLVAEAIRKLIQQHGVRSSKVISAVPGRAVIIKRFRCLGKTKMNWKPMSSLRRTSSFPRISRTSI